MTFVAWMGRVNRIVRRRCGVSVYDLPVHCPLRLWYDMGKTPGYAATSALKAVVTEVGGTMGH